MSALGEWQIVEMPVDAFMARFGPSNEGLPLVSGTWLEELCEQMLDPHSARVLARLVTLFRLGEPQEEPVLVDYSPDRVHDGHSRVLALWLTGRSVVRYGAAS